MSTRLICGVLAGAIVGGVVAGAVTDEQLIKGSTYRHIKRMLSEKLNGKILECPVSLHGGVSPHDSFRCQSKEESFFFLSTLVLQFTTKNLCRWSLVPVSVEHILKPHRIARVPRNGRRVMP